MKEQAFSIYDSKAEIWGKPMYAATTEAGRRLFHSGVNQEESQYRAYGGDYGLFEIGQWDDNKGVLVMHEHKINLGLAMEYLDQADDQEMTNGIASDHKQSVFNMQEHARKQLEQQNEELNYRLEEALAKIGKEA